MTTRKDLARDAILEASAKGQDMATKPVYWKYLNSLYPVYLWGAEDLAYFSYYFGQDIAGELMQGFHVSFSLAMQYRDDTSTLARSPL